MEPGDSVLQTIKREYVAAGYIEEYGEGENGNALIAKISTDNKKHTDKKDGPKVTLGFEILIIFFAIAMVLLLNGKKTI